MIKEMELSVKERLLLAAFFPAKGSRRDMTIVKAIKGKVDFSPEEREEIGLKQTGNSIAWKDDVVKTITIELNDDEREFLKRQTKTLDDDEGYTLDLVDLAKRIELL